MSSMRKFRQIEDVDVIVVIGRSESIPLLVHEVVNGILTRTEDWSRAAEIPIAAIPIHSFSDEKTSLSLQSFNEESATKQAISALQKFMEQQQHQTLSTLSSSKSISSKAVMNLLELSPIQAVTTLSGLRIFSHSRVSCRIIPPSLPPSTPANLCINKSWLNVLGSIMPAKPVVKPYNLAVCTNTARQNSETECSTYIDSNVIEDETMDADSPRLGSVPVGPALTYFTTICKRVLRPGNDNANVDTTTWAKKSSVSTQKSKINDSGGGSVGQGGLPEGWQPMHLRVGKNVSNSGKKEEAVFSCNPRKKMQDGVELAVLDVRCGSGINGGEDNLCENAAVEGKALCLYPPAGFLRDEERPRVFGLEIDGVGIYESRGFSMEILEGVALKMVRGTWAQSDENEENDHRFNSNVGGSGKNNADNSVTHWVVSVLTAITAIVVAVILGLATHISLEK
ncbi:hypothetical protein HK100_011406 [Physocladia obscura]|uniref:Uncharacterized protein n=1 Tax=Physocladia obscura TaxID=109957 RepID=A0AAD5TEK6_9FUNG|nr:hypothetical protein HK100_011406 [Physocladia obscura]